LALRHPAQKAAAPATLQQRRQREQITHIVHHGNNAVTIESCELALVKLAQTHQHQLALPKAVATLFGPMFVAQLNPGSVTRPCCRFGMKPKCGKTHQPKRHATGRRHL
jgi:hypothetical protein